MSVARRLALGLLLLPLAVALPQASGQTGGGDRKPAPPPPAPDRKPTPVPEAEKKPRLEDFRLPADAVVVICEKAADALRMVPDSVVLPARKYQDLLDEVARLREQLAARRAVPPSRFALKGKVEGNLALLTAQVDFVTERPDALVALACGQGVATAALLDGHTPLFAPDPDGFTLQVAHPGEHQLTLELTVPLVARRGGPALELSLPRAAVTTLDLGLPAEARDARVGGRPVAETLLTLKDDRLAGGLAPADRRLEVSWKTPLPPAGTPLLAADGRVVVHVDPTGTTTQAELTLRAEAGQVDTWRVLVPHGADLRVAREDEGRLNGPVGAAEQPGGTSLRTLHLHEASAEPLRVTVTTHGPVPKSGTAAVAVGPFAVLGAARQSGTVLVRNSADALHLDYRTTGPLRRQWPLGDDDRRAFPDLVAAFRYGGVGTPEAAPAPPASSPRPAPWLTVDVEAVHGQLKVQAAHELKLEHDETGGLVWYSTTTFQATPRLADVEQLRVLLPAGWERLDGETPANHVVTLKLNRPPGEAPLAPVTVTLRGRYTEHRSTEGRAELTLPRALDAVDEGGEITVGVDRPLGLVPPAATAGMEPGKQSPREQTWHSRATPAACPVAWRVYVPDVRVQSVADVELTPQGGEVSRHELRLRLPEGAPEQITLRVPPGVVGLRVVRGGDVRQATGTTRVVTLDRPGGADCVLVLRYAFTATHGAGPEHVPLVWPEPVSQGDARVRLWCESARRPVLPDGSAWREQPVEVVRDRPSLPVLVAAAPRLDEPLAVTWRQPREAGAVGVLVERADLRVHVSEGGAQECTARYRLRRLAGEFLDVDMPAPVLFLDLRVTCDGKQVTHEVVDEGGGPSTMGRVARLRLGPEPAGPASVLELSYRLSAGRAPASSWPGGVLSTSLTPPVIRGDPGSASVCWQVRVPPSWVVLGPESGPGVEREWSWRGRLPALRLRPAAGTVAEPDPAAGPPDVLTWRAGGEGLTLTCVPQQAWLLACSLAVAVLGLVLLTARRGGRLRAALGVPVLLALAAGALLRPAVLAAVLYGCEPGALVLAVLLLVQWLAHVRDRRRVFFLPSFSRKRTGSSITRGGLRPPGEPSTVDAPPRAAGSSAVP
jgi:hypothetical protein